MIQIKKLLYCLFIQNTGSLDITQLIKGLSVMKAYFNKGSSHMNSDMC